MADPCARTVKSRVGCSNEPEDATQFFRRVYAAGSKEWAWQLTRAAPHDMQVFLRDAEHGAARAFGKGPLSISVLMVCRSSVTHFHVGRSSRQRGSHDAIVHEPLGLLYESLPLVSIGRRCAALLAQGIPFGAHTRRPLLLKVLRPSEGADLAGSWVLEGTAICITRRAAYLLIFNILAVAYRNPPNSCVELRRSSKAAGRSLQHIDP